ncbi:hypothetical protein ACGF0K_12610, partial [Streptomyces sp. NPDC048156]
MSHPTHPTAPVPLGHRTEAELLAGLPPVRAVPAGEVAAAISGGRRRGGRDDDPTGPPTVSDVPGLAHGAGAPRRGARRPAR